MPDPTSGSPPIAGREPLILFEEIANHGLALGRCQRTLVQPEGDAREHARLDARIGEGTAHPRVLTDNASGLTSAHIWSSAWRERFSAATPAAFSVKYRFDRPPRCGVGSDIDEPM